MKLSFIFNIGTGTGGTYFDAPNYNFPGVPYSSYDFNTGLNYCSTGIDYSNPTSVSYAYYSIYNFEIICLQLFFTKY